MIDLDKLAKSLTKAQREAMMASHWSARQGADLQKLGLTYWGTGPHGRPMVKFRQVGLALCAHLKGQSDEG